MLTGDQLFQARTSAGMTQQQLANTLGVSLRSVGNWERSEQVPRSAETRVWKLLGTYLLEDQRPSASSDLAHLSDARLLAEIARRFELGRREVGSDGRSAPTSEEVDRARDRGHRDAMVAVIETLSGGQVPPREPYADSLLQEAYDAGRASLKGEELLDARKAASAATGIPVDLETGQRLQESAGVTQLPSAQALDPTVPADVAARDEQQPSKTQRARERQDREGES